MNNIKDWPNHIKSYNFVVNELRTFVIVSCPNCNDDVIEINVGDIWTDDKWLDNVIEITNISNDGTELKYRCIITDDDMIDGSVRTIEFIKNFIHATKKYSKT